MMRFRPLVSPTLICLTLLASQEAYTQSHQDLLSDVAMQEALKVPTLPWGADPFLMKPGFIASAQADEDPVLSAIIFNKTNPIAVVDGEVVSKGKVLSRGQLVVDIGRNYVLLESGDSLQQLTLDGVTNTEPRHAMEIKKVNEVPSSLKDLLLRAPAQEPQGRESNDKNE